MSRNARIGLVLFAIYTACYFLFVGLNAFAAETMAQSVIPNVNLATISGFALIAGALVLSLIYGVLCALLGDQQGQSR
jgi:uncharacterized membrane protein (DUF485 family)